MKKIRVYFEESPEPTPLDTPLDALLITTVLFAPLALGSIDPKFEVVLQIAIAVAAAMFGVKLTLYPRTRFVKSWTFLPIIGFVVLASLQLLPLPQGLVAWISPNTLNVKRDLLSDLPNVAELMQTLRLTFYPEATLRHLRQVLMVATVFVLVLNQFRTLAKIKLMLIALASLGAFCSALAILQIITGTDSIYWYIYSGSNRADAGTFANHSHFAQMANLCMGAMMALLFLILHEQLGPNYHATDFFDRLRAQQGHLLWLLLAGIVLSAIAILLCLSRGGAIAMMVAGVIAVSLYAMQNREGGFGWIGSMMAMLVAMIILYLAYERVASRFGQLHGLEPATMRWTMVLGCVDCWKQFPMTGVGLGAFRYVYPRYDRLQDYEIATHAENEYAQLLMETGVIGAAMIAAFILLIFIACFRAIRHRASPYAVVAIGLGFGWIAILIQSATDFGQHMPGVALITATVTAMIVAIARGATYEPAKDDVDAEGNAILRGLVTLGVMAAGGAASMSAISVYRADARWLKVLAQEDLIWKDSWQVDPQRVVRLVEDAQEVVEIRPNNVVYRHYFNQFRLRGGTMARDPESGAVLLNQVLIDAFRLVAQDIDQARPLCPTYGPLVAAAGGIRQFILNDPSGAALIEKATVLSPNDITVLRMSAQLQASRGNWDRAMQLFARYVKVQPGMLNDAVDLLIGTYHRPDLAVNLVGKSLAADPLVRQLQVSGADQTLIDQARRNLIDGMNERVSARSPLPNELIAIAREYSQLNDNTKAEELYRRAVDSSSADASTRLQYADFLGRIGRTEDALKQIDVVLAIDPFNDQAVALRRKLRLTSK